MKKWEILKRGGVGRFGYEVFWNKNNGNGDDRYWIKVYVFDKVVELSGDRYTIANKISELRDIFEELSNIFPKEDIEW